ncbi:alpha/beta fold hydrolase [Glycomyces algeriensis]|uniref:Alpha/beta hydrolase n=1 Tax=Glycomyces algeriensis TaxID=256037 RepID=A0A9W6GD39_9ACTN|nr:alpha/beta fold hydrolase [Glycomyces algeriensis]MDA1369125.1 alpha/beta fold hydrolase [Glycomyces algeriensis]MDR7351826.1 pimeloyl-ACP methyl ester carboxylesterase [Glycomyces algeriensis]GLI44553.1 alpha/beta hydrolase [Glycomyces algeriensis]
MNRLPLVRHASIDIDGVEVHYRESVPDRADAPILLLLHGFPTASHQFARLIDALGADHRLIAPDYPGFGQTTAPAGFTYSFDRLADIVEGFVDRLGLQRFAMYLFDFGAPVGLRLAERRPELVTGLVVQNGNAYTDGLSDAARGFIALAPEQAGAEGQIRDLLTLEGTRFQYETGAQQPERLSPDNWTLDQHYLDLPGRKEAQVALAFDYKSNEERYDGWQAWLRKHTPPTLIVWGTGDPFFTEAGARAYLRDLPEAELHLFDAGHFALETHLGEIAPLIAEFMERQR